MAVSNEALILCLLADASVELATETGWRERAARAQRQAMLAEEERRRAAAEPFFTPGRIAVLAIAGIIAAVVLLFFQDAIGKEREGKHSSKPPVSAEALAAGDLGLDVPMSFPDCDGKGIVVLASLTTPGRYKADVARALNQYPGAAYLRTDQSWPSLRQADEQGNPIYAVYRTAGNRQDQVCEAVRAWGRGAYGK